MLLAYFLKTETVGTTPFVGRSLNSAGSDPGGSPGARGHFGPKAALFLSGRRFGLWTLADADFCIFRTFPTNRVDANRSAVVALVGVRLVASVAAWLWN